MMNIFDKLLGGGSSDGKIFSDKEAMAGLLILVMTVDGHISEEESNEFSTFVNRMQLFRSQSSKEFCSMMDGLMALLKRKGPDFIFEKSIESLPAHLYDTAFAVATDLILADGTVETEEKELLLKFKNALKISDELTHKIVEVMRIKNRG